VVQPFLHDLAVTVSAPSQVWSARDGQIRRTGAQGVYDGDCRVLTRAELTVAGAEPVVVAAGPAGRASLEVVAVASAVDEPGADPTVRVRRVRVVRPGEVVETIEVQAATERPVHVPIRVDLACDLAPLEGVKVGDVPPTLPCTIEGGPVWSTPDVTVRVAAPTADVDARDPRQPALEWVLDVSPGASVTVEWRLTSTRRATPVLPATGPAPWAVPTVEGDDRRLAGLVARSLDDLAGLRLRAAFAPDDEFLAAGAPWFFTLFGRDALWAARMLLPLGTDLAAGTLRTLAARQGTRVDPVTAEQPGRILHEVRAADMDLGGGTVLPPVYYGTVDATPLWVCLLHDAWRWGMPAAEVEVLLPAMTAALEWMDGDGDADGDGFLEYLDATGRGLANQGWKDSGDSVQWRDGELATGPIALCEVQAYAYEAALGGAALLDAFGRPGADRWRAWAAELADRFRAAFWVHDESGPYPAIALDAQKRPVDALTSNIGHLLGTGLLDAAEEAAVARRLGSPELDSGYGLRTMATTAAGYWPMRYHGGSVWTHDTAIAIAGLVRAGHSDVATRLAEGLLAAAADVDDQLPELYAGDARGSVPHVVPYPSACHPQAWSAASAVVLLVAFLGLDPDVPGGTLRIAPAAPSPFGRLRVSGLRIGARDVTVEVAGDGSVRELSGTDLRVEAPQVGDR
jgi:glycogen debranching enzyme